MELDLGELERLAAQASPGPWTVDKDLPYCFTGTDSRFLGFAATRNPYAYDNATYIVGACNAVPELIKMYREAEDKANNAWRILLEAQARIVEVQKRVQELEAQRDWLASKLGDMCSVSSHGSCGVTEPCPYSKGYCRCLDAEQEEWVQVAKETM